MGQYDFYNFVQIITIVKLQEIYLQKLKMGQRMGQYDFYNSIQIITTVKLQVIPAERWQSTWQRLLSDIPEKTPDGVIRVQQNIPQQNIPHPNPSHSNPSHTCNTTRNTTCNTTCNNNHKGSVRRPKTATARIRY